jgi:succinate dehydrogenase (ubiquinone) flavoprotein subunit
VRCFPVQLQDRSLVWNTDLLEACELDNLLTNAAITVHSAEARTVRLYFVA